MAVSNALHTKEITTAQVSAVSFGFFSEDEVSCLAERMFYEWISHHMHVQLYIKSLIELLKGSRRR
jgi:hypothetical protein